MITWDEYIEQADSFATSATRRFDYLVDQVVCESAEVLDKISKRIHRDTFDLQEGLKLELGDVCWNLALLERWHDFPLDWGCDVTGETTLAGTATRARAMVRATALFAWDTETRDLDDVPYLVGRIAAYAGCTYSEIWGANIEKLTDRRSRGVLSGDGDYR